MSEIDSMDEFQEDAHARIDLSMWSKLFGYTKPYKRDLWQLGIAAFITGVLEMTYPLITKWVIDDVVANGIEANLLLWSVTYAVSSLLLAISVAIFVWTASKIRIFASHDIRRDAFENLQKQSFAYFDYKPIGWLLARLTSDCERLTNIIAWGFLDLIWGSTMMVAVTFVLFYMHWQLALLVGLLLPVIYWISVKFRRSILNSAREVRATNSAITGSFNESIMGVQTSKAYVRENANLNDFENLTRRMYRASVRNLTLSAIYVPVILVASSVSYGITLAFGGSEFLAGSIVAGSLIAFMLLVRYFYDPIEVMGHWFTEMQMAQASAERVLGVINAEPQIRDAKSVQDAILVNRDLKTRQDIAIDGGRQTISQIELRDVSFAYETGEQVLHQIELHIHQGESIAFVGPTGGGKSTLVNVICRFYEPTAGQILYDGVDYRSRSLNWLHSNLGIVLQQAHIFGGTIIENIRYGRLDASDEDVREACRIAGAEDFILAMPDGYGTEVGESGNRLSAGQKQLLSLARAILADPQILVLDEATSSVDTETEHRIQQAVENLLEGRLSLVIAHRLSTIRNVDRIIFIDDGRIVESGTHVELLAKQGRYFELYSQQSLDSSFLETLRHQDQLST